MFTGIIEELGSVDSLETRSAGARLRVKAKTVLSDATEGASIAVNGVCLTAVDLRADSFAADLAPETVRRTNLGDLRGGSRVNLERPLAPTSRLSGHIVQGHVDGTGELLAIDPLGNENWWLRVRVPAELDRYLVFKGSIAIDGVSLTLVNVTPDTCSIALIPHTLSVTTLGFRQVGDPVNLETDILGKYVLKMLDQLALRPQ